ncbi:Midasin [Thalictrum thalictroides]|uniref:Midasin n=1 Tax=Thalictrum thalictroides TaxID=46969 RepID=A0A7J6WUX0_THATH|nr:Midasin [Thalictrum thalictroides]
MMFLQVGNIALGVLWRRVAIRSSTKEELLHIINVWYPKLEAIAEKLIETYDRIRDSDAHRLGTSPSFNRFSIRDLLKWCKRIESLGFSFFGHSLSAHELKNIYQEAVDIFAASPASCENRLFMMKEIAKIWGVSAVETEDLFPSHKPSIQELQSGLEVGRVTLKHTRNVLHNQTRPFVKICSSLHLLERIACSVKHNEPVLLVGETGTGKTTLVQNLASRLGQPLTVVNLSQQSDVADLLGGLKPTDPQFICIPLYNDFMELFRRTFSDTENLAILGYFRKYRNDKNWKKILEALQKGHQKVLDITRRDTGVSGSGKRKRPLKEELLQDWEQFSDKLKVARRQIDSSSCVAFSFVEGAFITSLKSGHWILLDEVNLAPPETLQRIMGVLEGEHGSLCLSERGDVDYVERHTDFRLFACMNPATDAGKRDLPFSVRSRFTEYFVDEILNDEDLALFVNQFLDDSFRNQDLVNKIVQFYKEAKRESEERLQDGANQKPRFSLRSLYRALEYAKKAARKFGFQKALYDGFCMFFLTLLDGPSAKLMNTMICSSLLKGTIPQNVPFDTYLNVAKCTKSDDYILTPSVKEHLRNLARAILIKRYPVLLQGPTSSGKTSLVRYLATITNHEFVRINNHEHTDLQEYLGSYVTDSTGKLVFQEGVLVKAVRSGCWIVLDELNLAPSDVLEALNRLLDDNRELFVPELQETIKAHPDFMLFATQNPPTFYGGRKMLSRAFRNRFVEIHVDEIPENELSTILEQSCKIPKSYANRMVDIMKDLQLHRQSSKIFAGKHGFITPRDLFRWANRFRELGGKSYEDLAKDGYFLLAERLRDDNEKNVVREILKRHLPAVELVEADLYKQDHFDASVPWHPSNGPGVPKSHGDVVWTKSMQRLYFLVDRCYKMREPVLLVGETGGGKTTLCQLLSTNLRMNLNILNCHQFTETSDFLGGFYPVRDRSLLVLEFQNVVQQLMLSNVMVHFPEVVTLSSDIAEASLTLNKLNDITNSYRKGQVLHTDVTEADLEALEQMKMNLIQLHQKWQTIFTWHDGPLVQAMRKGDLFLVDEISLADDSVLERLNSVLEPERKLSLAEKGGSMLENVTAHPNFFLLATMNPGGDYGKKELSPALRNRFTEIWVPPVSDSNELRSIASSFVGKSFAYTVDPMLKFWDWFGQLHTSRTLTVRDLLSWVEFMKATEKSFESPNYAFIHGAFLVLLDGLGLGTGISKHDAGRLREQCLSFLLQCLKQCNINSEDSQLLEVKSFDWDEIGRGAEKLCDRIVQSDEYFGITPFSIKKGDNDCKPEGFEFLAPTTCRNAMRVLRAMQLMKPILLEGSPGVGKTSLVVALGKFSGHRVVRINLSEQTDIMDLLGSDLPVEDVEGMKFAWSDGILLQALKNGDWVLLDELNLAPQSVLEGLNAILDHRAEVFIPELGHTYKCPSSFRVFACQNPSCQGGGRKGLPKSFLNRFTKVYVDELMEEDYFYICNSLHPSIPKPLLTKLILFNKRLYADTMESRKYGQDGSPWEFNLRDVIRSCEIIESVPEKSKHDCFLNVIYIQRMRTASDRQEVVNLYEDVFGVKPFINPYPRVQVNPQYLIVGNAFIERNYFQPSAISKSQLNILPGIRHSFEAVVHCVQRQWLCILVGPSASGKTSLLRLLAHLTGNVLNELNLSSATDISELLGCFEQYNAFRNFRSAICQVERYIDEYCSMSAGSSLEELVNERNDLVTNWFTFSSSIYTKFMSDSASAYTESWKSASDSSLGLLIQIIEQLKLGLKRYQLLVSWSHKDLDKVLKCIVDLQEYSKKQVFSAKFEWITGLLIKAIEFGEWIVLENANLCNPTVLDRINSLVEPSGSITVNECGLVDGKPVVLHPNGKFRLFLTVNPSYGEVSRAMRNRGVEVCMMQPNWVNDDKDGYISKETEVNDVKRFLVLSGIPLSILVNTMSEAHIFACSTGLSLNVQITLLELTRWVQLFQQLLLNGNRPVWSLQISWEHTYLSSMGEFEGRSALEHAKRSFFSVSNLTKLNTVLRYSLSLPGGWPAPLRLRDFVWNSKEACVKQNCMYLEFLGAQCASYELYGAHYESLVVKHSSMHGVGQKLTTLLDTNKKLNPSLIPLRMLHQILFPTTSYQLSSECTDFQKFDLELVNKMLLFAANWTMEQASEGDFKLYLLCLSRYSSQLGPYCRFFESYLDILKQELDHPIWTGIFECRRKLASHYIVDLDRQHIPVLSLKFLDMTESDENLQSFEKCLYNSTKCADLLHRSVCQWKVEDDHYCQEKYHYLPVLESLRELEKEVLHNLVDSPFFDVLFPIYSNVIERHSLLWDGIISFKYERLIRAWRSLEKDVTKLQSFFPTAVKHLLMRSNEVGISFRYVKSMLWVNGGHPFLPSSADTYSMTQQLLKFCQMVWPANLLSWKQPSSGNHILVKAIVSANTQLRSLAMQGVSMSAFLTSKGDQDDASIVQQLEEMHQILLRRFQHEKEKLEDTLASTVLEKDLSYCCDFFPEKFHKQLSVSNWQEMYCLFDSTSFFLDMELLKKLSRALLMDEELYKVLSNNSDLLETSLSFSIKFSSRPPTDFIPHQTVLWALDAWESVDSVNIKIANSVLEMWFRWHSFLWTHCPEPFKDENDEDGDEFEMLLAGKRQGRLMQSSFPIKEFDELCLTLRVASGNLWHDSPSKRNLPDILLCAACSLFEQIIYAHKKSFEKNKYAEIKSTFASIPESNNKNEMLQSLTSLIASSRHSSLTSLIESFISPLLRELYLQNSSHDILENVGHAWLHVGGLRFNLLLTPDNFDPVSKYSIKHSQIVEKISLLELEIKVRQECEGLVGRSSSNDALKQRRQQLKKLEVERKRLLRKVVYRNDASKFSRMKSEFSDFLKLPVPSSKLAMNIPEWMNKALNWQETASSFINRLSNEYAVYADITQPVQVAVYEMKLGLSLVVSSALQKTFLAKMEESTTERILDSIYSFMRFPRLCAVPFSSVEASNGDSDYLSSDQDVSVNFFGMDIILLEKLCAVSGDHVSENMVSLPQLHAALYHNVLVCIMHNVVNTHLLGYDTFMFLNKVFDKFAGLWMSMKIQTKAKEDDEARSYRFKTRQFKIEDIFEVDVSTLRKSFSDESLSLEWQDMLAEDECTEWVAPKEHENLEEEWGLIQESILNSMVHIHNQLFGSHSLVENAGFNQISDADKLSSFLESYKLGLELVKVLPALLPSSLDAKLVPEHLLYLCLNYEEKFGLLNRAARIYNFYKDSNAPVVAKIVNPLIALQQRVLSFLNDWPDHPFLQKILDITEMLLAISLSTPLAKVLSSLQFLVNKAHQLQENAPKLSLSDQMQPILLLVSTFQKMELESWPALLDEVQEQYEINSGKLWFPLHSVVYRRQTSDMSEDNQSTIRSFEEFIQTSSVGEFKRRLQLLLAFHGQISTGLKLCLHRHPMKKTERSFIESNPSLMENMEKILYNVFGYHVQFLPVVLGHIEAIKKKISADLRELVKIYRWERPDNYLSMETSKRTRQKLRKHIQKFTDALQQPVMVILNQEAAKRGIKIQTVQEQKISTDTSAKKAIVSSISIDLKLFSEAERSIGYNDWKNKVNFALACGSPKSLSPYNLQYECLKDVEETEGFLRKSLTSQTTSFMYWEEWQELWLSLEKISRTVTECADLWEVEKKSFGKRRALSDLLKLLKSFGLSKHSHEGVLNSNEPISWFLQTSYDVHHLLLPASATASGECTLDHQFQLANQYYFKSMAMVQLLRQICLNFHKDFSLDQIKGSASVLEHLIVIQQEQRSFGYKLSKDLQSLRNCMNLLKNLRTEPYINDNETGSESVVAFKQCATYKCMWNQKKLFDDLSAISHDISLLLRKVEVTHLSSCQNIKLATSNFLVSIEKFIPRLRKSKESLDQYLLGGSRISTTADAFSSPFIVLKKMEQLVMQNFQDISELEEHLGTVSKQEDERSVKQSLIGHFGDVLNMGMADRAKFRSVLESRNQEISMSNTDASLHPSSEVEASFVSSFRETLNLIMEVFQKLGSSSSAHYQSEDLSANMTRWKVLAESYQDRMQLNRICKKVAETISSAVQLIDTAGDTNPTICCQIQTCLTYLHVVVDPILTLGDGFLAEFLAMHRAVAETTHMLATVFASLFSKGFGASTDEQTDDTDGDVSQDASGTGMGEGAGVNDVSDQIEDEDQLLGTSEKPTEGLDNSNEAPSKNEKGIEMDQDFAGDTCSVSEDSGDDDSEDSEDVKLDTAMGKTGDESEVVDEKHWNKDDDENPDTANEKYESGPSVRDTDSSSREMRAKEDDAMTGDESAEFNVDESQKDNTENGDQSDPDHDESVDDMKMNKETAYEDPTGVQLDDQTHSLEEDTTMEELEGSDAMEEQDGTDTMVEQDGTDTMEEGDPVDLNETSKNGEEENGTTNQQDGDMEKESRELDGNAESKDGMKDVVPDFDLLDPSKNASDQGRSNFNVNSVPCTASGMQLNADTQTLESSSIAPKTQWSNSENMENGLAPTMGLPSSSTSESKITMPDSLKHGELTADEPKAQSPQHDKSSLQRTHPNPYRSVGDALENWKERVKVSIDAEEHKPEFHDEMEDDNANEYGFVPELEEGTSQALGPATSDQIDRNIKGSNPDGGEDHKEQHEDHTEMEVHRQDPETLLTKNHSALMQKLDEQIRNSVKNEIALDEMQEDHDNGGGSGDDDSKIMSRNLVSVKKSYMDEEILQLSNLNVNDEELGKAKNLEISGDIEIDATKLWRRYEQITARLSQELAEQLRLVMEPTLASKLQGDYKTGKRINMKKVIAFIASHYRKDRIWLRRTRPNKRDYQVVVAVDDSRSMSESHCGDVAIESLVTVCRAMSQLEVGQLAVASYGKKGNIQLLHDFNQHFTAEAGMKIISSLTFKQENTIVDEPVVDLLQYLNSMLDAAAVNSRLSSGQSPLQQLVLIIADGRFHEKERLKRCVRDLLSKNRMVAFLLVDSPQESIMDFMEASFEGEKLTFSKYLNSFPFPYYIVLKDIEALPRTLADLLRQWFELMQNARN